jgi:GT2 family glycosyltransferase
MPSAAPEVSIVVVTHDSSRHLDEWLRRVERLKAHVRIEVCVVDSGSSAAEREWLDRDVRPRVDVLVLEVNLGYGAACNVAARVTSAPVLLFTNPDSYLVSVPHEVRDVAVLRGRILGPMQDAVPAPAPMGFRHAPTARLQIQSLLLGRRSRLFDATADDPAYVSGAALLITRHDLERLGGWASDYFLYFEDADLCLRFKRLGGRVEVAAALRIDHQRGAPGVAGGDSADELSRMAISLRSGRLFVRRYQGALPAMTLYVFVVLAYLPRRLVKELALRLLRGRPFTEPPLTMVLDSLLPGRAAKRLAYRPAPKAVTPPVGPAAEDAPGTIAGGR